MLIDACFGSRDAGIETIDLVLAFGLFGDLDVPEDSPFDNAGNRQRRALGECHRMLKTGGSLLVSNSSDRQPVVAFLADARETGFEVERTHESTTIYGAHTPGELRYFVALRK